MPHVFVVTISHEHGVDAFAAATRDAANAALADYCRHWWETDGPAKRLPRSNAAVIAEYFGFQREDGEDGSYAPETYEIRELPVLGAAAMAA